MQGLRTRLTCTGLQQNMSEAGRRKAKHRDLLPLLSRLRVKATHSQDSGDLGILNLFQAPAS